MHQNNYDVRRLIKKQYEKSLKDKLAKDNKAMKKEQQGLKDFLVYRKDRKVLDRKDWVKTDDDSPLLAVQGGVLFNNLRETWTGYRIGKNKEEDDEERRKEIEYAVKIQAIQKKIGYSTSDFSRIGISRDAEDSGRAEMIKKYIDEGEYLGDDIM